ncbi:MAG: YitT family protein [Limnochordales bacterium]|nr:YitT family protein [Limnochordales bacterium]
MTKASGAVDKRGGRRRWPALRATLAAYAGLTAGVALVALGLNWFLVPHRLAAGGVSGLAVVVHHLFGLPVGATMLVINIPLFILAARVLGIAAGARSIYGFVSLSLIVDALAPYLSPLTQDPVLASIYGGVLVGIGVGITYRLSGSTGGTALGARLIHHYLRIGTGRALLLADGIVILLAGIAFGPELALYALLSVFITIRVVDLLEEGTPHAKAAIIVSDAPDRVAQLVLHELQRGATALQGRGLYTGRDRQILLVIVDRDEVGRLKQLVRSADPTAFVVISDVHEALGEGFRRLT